jgi:hypothetical protein
MTRALLLRPRQLLVVSVWWAFVGSPTLSLSASLDTLSSRDAAGGLRAALSQGIDTAVAQLGARDGFLNDPKVAIPLPPALEKADRALRMVGMGGDADALKAAMNHALIKAQDANLNDYVTAKALDGLFSRIADEERAIRKDPLGQASSLIKKVFGALR